MSDVIIRKAKAIVKRYVAAADCKDRDTLQSAAAQLVEMFPVFFERGGQISELIDVLKEKKEVKRV